MFSFILAFLTMISCLSSGLIFPITSARDAHGTYFPFVRDEIYCKKNEKAGIAKEHLTARH